MSHDMMPITDNSKRIIEMIRNEIHFAQSLSSRAKVEGADIVVLLKEAGPPKIEEAPTAEDYVDMVANILNLDQTKMTPQTFAEAVLSNGMLEIKLKEIRSKRNAYIQGSRDGDIIQLAILPFPNNIGPYYNPKEIEDGLHLKELVRQSRGNQLTVAGIIQDPSYLGHVIPFAECSFKLKPGFKENPEEVAEQYKEAFMKLRKRLAEYCRSLKVVNLK